MKDSPLAAMSAKRVQVKPNPSWPVLVVEDEGTTQVLLCNLLENHDLVALPFNLAADALEHARHHPEVGAVLIDLALPDMDGLELLRELRALHPGLPCFILTAEDRVASAVQAMKAGAEDYFTKPFDPEALVVAVKGALAVSRKTVLHHPGPVPSLDGRWKSAAMQQAIESAVSAARTRSPVFITGPPNCGKRAFARFIHQSGAFADQPFQSFNLATVQPKDIENELLGTLHPQNGTPSRSGGRLRKCHNATLYLENIELLPPPAQAALADWLSDNTSHAGNGATCRLMASSSTDIPARIANGSFSRELWYALAVYHVRVPALAERHEDMPLLCEDIITSICVRHRLRRPTLTRRALEVLMDHPWPDNLSELANALEHAVTHTQDGLISPADLPRLRPPESRGPNALPSIPLGLTTIDEVTKASLIAALDACDGNRRRAAQRLKVSLRTVYNMIRRFGLVDEKPSGARKQGRGNP